MRNKALESLDGLVGDWTLTISDAVFLETPETEVGGSVSIEWFGDAFLTAVFDLGGELTLVLGHSDANDRYVALYHDDRGVSRVFDMTWGDGEWTMLREDPDFHQRFISEVTADRIVGRWEMSEDEGATWRKDFDLTFERR